MKVTIAFGSKLAIPVRALPFVTGLVATPRDIARELAEENGRPQFEAYWANVVEEIPSRQWGPVYEALEDLIVALGRKHPDDNENRQAMTIESVRQLPAGAFVWADRFEHWFSTTYMAEDTVWEVQHLVIGEDEDSTPRHSARWPGYSVDLSPIVPHAFQTLVMEGFEPGEYAEMLAANRIEVDDFLRLTGLRFIGDHGLYRISQNGVRASSDDWDLYAPGITVEERAEIRSFSIAARLDFPCTPQGLVEWANGINWDFQLPIRFVRAAADEVQHPLPDRALSLTPSMAAEKEAPENSPDKEREEKDLTDGADTDQAPAAMPARQASIELIESEQSASDSVDGETVAATDENPSLKLEIRKAAMLSWLTASGYTPSSLPNWKGESEGVKAKLKKAMIEQGGNGFTESTFKKAWEDLSKNREVQYKK